MSIEEERLLYLTERKLNMRPRAKFAMCCAITGIVLVVTSHEDSISQPALGWMIVLTTLYVSLRPRRVTV